MQQIRKRVSSIVIHNDSILGFHAKDPTNGKLYFFLPGGEIEAGETVENTAIRETREETGYTIEVFSEHQFTRSYVFYWNGAHVPCETTFVLGRLVSQTQKSVEDASYHQGVDWIKLQKLDEVFSYHEQILQSTQTLCGKFLETNNGVSYFLNRPLMNMDIIRVLDSSGIRRPTNDRQRITQMFNHSNLVVSAWQNNVLVGIARALSDFNYSTYLSDLAVQKEFQNQGIGKLMLTWVKNLAGERSNLLLLSAILSAVII